MSHPHELLGDFGGTVRLFPLPNLVMFPHIAQPLHIFEPRYRQMMADALDDDRLLAMALLRPDWEEEYHKQPAIYPVVCVGRIDQEERLSDGRYNLMLQGLSRARIVEEVSTDKQYRIARVELCQDVPAPPGREKSLRESLGAVVRPFFSANAQGLRQLERLLASELPLGALCDLFSYAMPVELEVKQRLLETLEVEERVRLLLAGLDGKAQQPQGDGPKKPFPPSFSSN